MPKEYVPSPWLREEITGKVRIPPAIVGALYQLQGDKQEVEYGGAIDFELIRGRPAVERVLTYTGVVRAVPGEIWEKVFANPDIELTFHSHPKQNIAIPSDGDIIFFLTTAAQAMLIVAGEEAILLTKGIGTPPHQFAIEHIGDTRMKAVQAISGLHGERAGYVEVRARQDQEESRRELKRLLDIDTVVFPIGQPIEMTIKIIRDVLKKDAKKLEIFKSEV